MKRIEFPKPAKPPFQATRQFRVLVLSSILGACGIVVYVVEIRPRFRLEPSPAALRARAIEPEPPSTEGLVLFDGLLEAQRDGEKFSAVDPARQRVAAHFLSRDETLALPAPPRFRSGALLENPTRHRGAFLRFEGLFLRSDPVRLDRPIEGREWIYRTYLSSRSGDEGYVIDLIVEPKAPSQAAIAVEGIFVRVVSYDAFHGSKRAPYFVGRLVPGAVLSTSSAASESPKVRL